MRTVHKLTAMFNNKNIFAQEDVLKITALFIALFFVCFGLCLAIIKGSSANSPVAENGSVEWFLA